MDLKFPDDPAEGSTGSGLRFPDDELKPESSNPLVNLGKGLAKGAVYGVPQQLAQASQFLGIGGREPGDIAQKVSKWGEEGMGGKEAQPGMVEQAGQMIPMSAGPAMLMMGAGKAISMIPHPIAKGIGAATYLAGKYVTPWIFGLSQAQQTKETAEERGVEPGTAPYKTGAIEVAGETLGNIAFGRVLGPLGKVGTALFGQMGAKQALKGTVGGFLKELALVTMPTEISTEMGQNYYEAQVEKRAGIRPEADPWAEAVSAIGPTAIMTVLMGGAGHLAHQYMAAKQGEILSNPINIDMQDPNFGNLLTRRMNIAAGVADIIPKENQELRDQWTAYATNKIKNNLPIDVNASLDSLSMEIDTQMDGLQAERKVVEQLPNIQPTEIGQPGYRGIGGQELQGPANELKTPPDDGSGGGGAGVNAPAPVTPITPAPTPTPAPALTKEVPEVAKSTVFGTKGYATEGTALLALKNRKLSLKDYEVIQREGRYYVEPKQSLEEVAKGEVAPAPEIVEPGATSKTEPFVGQLPKERVMSDEVIKGASDSDLWNAILRLPENAPDIPAIKKEFAARNVKLEPIISAKPGATAEGKPAWEMTKKEYAKARQDGVFEHSEAYHFNGIVAAIREGKPVPESVLKDYPDLKAEGKGTTATRTKIAKSKTVPDYLRKPKGPQSVMGILRKNPVDFKASGYSLKDLRGDIGLNFIKLHRKGADTVDARLQEIKADHPGMLPQDMTADEFVEMIKGGKGMISTGVKESEEDRYVREELEKYEKRYGTPKEQEAGMLAEMKANEEENAKITAQEREPANVEPGAEEFPVPTPKPKVSEETGNLPGVKNELNLTHPTTETGKLKEEEVTKTEDMFGKDQKEMAKEEGTSKVSFNVHRQFQQGMEYGAMMFGLKAKGEDVNFRIAAIRSGARLAREQKAYEQGAELAHNEKYAALYKDNKNLLNQAIKNGDVEASGWKYENGYAEETNQNEMAREQGDYGRSDYSPGSTAILDLYDNYRENSKDTTHSPADIVAAYEKATGLTFPYKWMVPMLEKMGIRISFDASLITRRDTAAGVYQHDASLIIYGDMLNLNRNVKGEFTEIFAHEGLHAIVETELGKNTQLSTELKSKLLSFIKDIKPYLDRAPNFVTNSMMQIEALVPKELVNLAFTNKKFATWLDSIKVPGAVKPSNTLWGKLKSIISGVIGKMPNVKTKLDELNDIMDSIMNIGVEEGEQSWKDQAKALDITFNGMQERYNKSDLPMFTDKQTGSSFMKMEKETLTEALDRVREGYKMRGEVKGQGQLFMPMDLGDTMKRTMGTLYSTFTNNPQNLPKTLNNTLRENFKRLESGSLKGIDYAFSNPFMMSQKYDQWKTAWKIHGIERAEKRSALRAEHVGYADEYLTIDKRLKKDGLNKVQRKEAKSRVVRMVFASDIMLHDKLVELKDQVKDATGQSAIDMQKQIDDILKLRRFSDEQLRNGIIDEYGNTIKLNSPTEIATYTAVRNSMDKMMESKIDWLHTMAFRKWKDQKWYNLLLQASGVDLSKETIQTMVGKQGLNAAAISYAQKIQVDLGNIFNRIDNKIDGASTDELVAVAERYDKLSGKVQTELTKFKSYLGKVTGITDEKQLSDLTRDVFAAYVQTRPYLKQIKTLRNQMNEWVGYAPRTREQGKFKIRLVETIFNDEGTPTGERAIHSIMFNNIREYQKHYVDIMSKYADKDGKLPPNQSVTAEKVTVSPEMAFQGVNDVNTQKIIDDAISKMKLRETYYDDKGNPIDIYDQLKEASYQAIANQFMTRGAAKAQIHRNQEYGTIKGYDEENLDRVLIGYLSSMTGLMTKQLAAADFIDLLKGETDKSMFEGLSKYNREMLRNDSQGDKVSGMVRSFAFVWYLGGLLKSAAINLTQNPIVGFAELSKYMRENGIKGVGDFAYASAMKDVLMGKTSTIENRLINELISTGIAQDQYIQSIFEGLQSKQGQAFSQVARFLATPFSMSEVYNRKSAGVAIFRQAYPMYLKQGLSEEDAYTKAFADTRTFIDNVHYAYGKSNRPIWMQSGGFSSQVLHTAYTFRGFTHNFLIRQATVLSQGDWRTFVKTMAYIGVLGGLMGLPFFKDFFEWIEKQFGYSATKVIRKSLRGWGGKTLEEFGMTGLPSVLGANISGSLATGLPWPIGAETPEDTVFGVYGGMIQKVKKAKEAFGKGDTFRGMTEVSPEVLRNPLVAARESQFGKEMFGTPGFATTTRGKVMEDTEGKPIRIKGTEVALKAIGFNPTESAREREMNQTIKRQETWASEAKASAGEEYRIARLNNRPDALKNMMMAVKDINQGIKSRGISQLVPPATVSKIIAASRESKTKQMRKEMRYKREEL